MSNNDFIMQLVSDLIGVKIDRPETKDMTSLGAAFLAGLAVGKLLYMTRKSDVMRC